MRYVSQPEMYMSGAYDDQLSFITQFCANFRHLPSYNTKHYSKFYKT